MLDAERLKRILNLLADWTSLYPGDPLIKDGEDSFENHVFRVHRLNCLLWANEDQARREDIAPSDQVAVKRESHRLNQTRNDAIEKIDEWLLTNCYGHLAERELPLRTETPGSALDRLTILSLKIHHMSLQCDRTDASRDHLELCRRKLEVLETQRRDLEGALLAMIEELNLGRIRMKVYRQFKMYNDPNFNPHLAGLPPVKSEN